MSTEPPHGAYSRTQPRCTRLRWRTWVDHRGQATTIRGRTTMTRAVVMRSGAALTNDITELSDAVKRAFRHGIHTLSAARIN